MTTAAAISPEPCPQTATAAAPDARLGLPLALARVERRDTANLFVMVEPLAGWRHVAVTAHWSKQDYAECLH